jgi:hypothetical protein
MNQFARAGTKQSKTGWVRKLAAAAALAVALPVILTPPADALARRNLTGRPGTVTGSLPMTAAYDGNGADGQPPVFQTNGMRTGRSPASTRWQRVTVIYVLQQYSDHGEAPGFRRWHNIASSRRSPGYVHGTSKVTYTPWRTELPHPEEPLLYRFVYIVRWEVNATGRKLGSFILQPDKTDENACYTQVRQCSAAPAGVIT